MIGIETPVMDDLADDEANCNVAGLGVAPIERLLLTDAEAAVALGISRAHLRALDRRGLVPRGLTLGRCRRWSLAELRAWAAAGCPDRIAWQAHRFGEPLTTRT